MSPTLSTISNSTSLRPPRSAPTSPRLYPPLSASTTFARLCHDPQRVARAFRPCTAILLSSNLSLIRRIYSAVPVRSARFQRIALWGWRSGLGRPAIDRLGSTPREENLAFASTESR